MRIAIFSEIYHPVLNGVVVSIDTFRKALLEKGHEVFVFAPAHPNFKDKDSCVFRFFSLPYPAPVPYRLPFPFPRKVFSELERFKPDVIHTQGPFFSGWMGLQSARRFGVPSVFTYHTQYDQYTHYVPFFGGFALSALHKWLSFYCNQCDAVVFPGSAIAEKAKKNHLTKPCFVLPTGIHILDFQKSNPQSKLPGIPQDGRVLMYVGRLAKEKNIPFLMSALSHTLNEEPETYLVLVGGGPYENDLKRMAKELGIDSHVTFAGAQPRAQVAQFLRTAEVFVFSSLTETQGLVVLEAMASGTPVVAVSASGVIDVLENGVQGFLCGENPAQFAQKTCEILKNDDLRRKMSQSCLARAREYTADSQAEKLVKIYEGVISQR